MLPPLAPFTLGGNRPFKPPCKGRKMSRCTQARKSCGYTKGKRVYCRKSKNTRKRRA